MKSPHLIGRLVLLAGLALAWGGCSKSNRPLPEGSSNKITGSPSDPPVELTTLWTTGKQYRVNFTTVVTSAMPWRNRGRNGSPGSQEISLDQDFGLRVLGTHRDGRRDMELELLTLKVDVAMGDNYVFNYDSENHAVSYDSMPGAGVLKNLLGGKLRFQILPDETVGKVEGIKELTDRMNDGGGIPMARGLLQRLFSPENLRQLVDMTALPGTPVRIGDSWPVRREVAPGPMGSFVMEGRYTFKGWQLHQFKKCALLELQGEIQTRAPTASPRPNAPTNATPNNGPRGRGRGGRGFAGGNLEVAKSHVSGKSWYDPEQGLVIDTDLQLGLTVKFPNRSRRATNEPPSTVEVPIQQLVSMTISQAPAPSPLD